MSSPILQYPLRQAATAAAQAPVPQAMVSPLPRSQTRILSVRLSSTSMNSVFTPLGNILSFSNLGPMASRSSSMGSPPNITQCGLPMDTQVAWYSPPATAIFRPTTLSPGRLTGMRSGTSSALPMSTVTAAASPPSSIISQYFTPLNVSISKCFFRHSPVSYRNFATHRMPLPHIMASLPSALKMRIFPSAVSEGQTNIIPSPPTPLCRSERSILRPSGSAIVWLKQSKYI